MTPTIIVTLVMGLIEAFAPGLPVAVVNFIKQLILILPSAIAEGTDLVKFVEEQISAIQSMVKENRGPTQTEWDTLNAQIGQDQAALELNAEKSE